MLSRKLKNPRLAVGLLSVFCALVGGVHAVSAQSGSPQIWMDSANVLLGLDLEITISASGNIEASALNLLFSYDRAFGLVDIHPLGAVANWEYFTYRISIPEGCGPDCDTGLVRLTGIADLPGGVDPGNVFSLDGEIAQLTLQAPLEGDYNSQCYHWHWVWNDCNDNSLISVAGDTAFLAADIETLLPGENCLDQGGAVEMHANLAFSEGIICIIGPGPERGDINLNGVPWEIGDAVLFSNYFAHGPDVLHDEIPPDYYDNRVLASDINDDGTPLTVADLVYLIRIIAEGAMPYGH